MGCRAAPLPHPTSSCLLEQRWRKAAPFSLPVAASALLQPGLSPLSATKPGCSSLLPAAPRSCISGTNPLFLFLPSPLPHTGSIQYQEPWHPAALCLPWSILRGAKTPRAASETTAMTTTSASARQGYMAAPSSLPPQERVESGCAQGKAFPTPLWEPGRPSCRFKAQSHTAVPSECNNWSSCCPLPLDGLMQPSRGCQWLPVTTSFTPSEGVSPPADAGR